MSKLFRTRFKREIICEFLPPKKTGSHKVVIFCAGMPTYPGKGGYEALALHFSQKGYWCFIPRYRGSWESEGKMFKDSPEKDIRDVIEGISKVFTETWGGKKFVVEQPEIYMFGSSFGGPAVLLNSTHKLVKKVICFSPVIDWRTMDKTIEPIPKMSTFVKEAFGMGYRIVKNGWKKIEQGKFYNPATELKKIDASKCLIFHAKDDDVVLLNPLVDFANRTNVKTHIVKTGGHLGMAILEKRFYKKALRFLSFK
jgi:esterase/lipase